MSASNGKTPIIVGAAQFTQRKSTREPLEPILLMVKACQLAFNDAGVEIDNLEDLIDELYVSNFFSWSYRDPPGELCKTLAINPVYKYYMSYGGHTPQRELNRAAASIALGKSRAILLTGGESYHTYNLIQRNKISVNWPKRRVPKQLEEHDKLNPASDFEARHHCINAASTYALIETALRSALGRTIEEHKEHMGLQLERFSKIASEHPYAWFQTPYSAEEITTLSKDNRYLCHPYTKRMISYHYVDQSAALLMISKENAERLNINKKKWVYLMGGSDLKHIHFISQRPHIHAAPAISKGAPLALEQAGLTLNDIGAFDIYSCFPCMVEIVKRELGIPDNDNRKLTITGGLPFFGGAVHNYSMHAIVTAVDLIRKDPSLKIMVTANGGYNSKHSIGIYGSAPPKIPWGVRDDSKIQKEIEDESLPEPTEQINGVITIEGFTIVYQQNGQPELGIVIGKLVDGRRTIANIEGNPDELKKLDKKELVGMTFNVTYDAESKRNLIKLK